MNPPFVSVIIPVRNVATTVDDQLAALAAQTYDGHWEVVVSDNGSTDATRDHVREWEGKLPAMTIVDSSDRRGVAHARNVGIAAARGDLILICDGDDIVDRAWVEQMVASLAEHSLVTGCLEVRTLNEPSHYVWSGEADAEGPERAHGFLPYPAGGNLGMRREVFDRLAGFSENVMRIEDIDFGWRAAYAGFAVHYEPSAVIHRRLHGDLVGLARVRYQTGMSEPLLYRRHRRRGMPRQTWAEVRETWGWLVRQLPGAVVKPEARHRWTAHAAKRVGRAVGSVRHRTRFL